ncbi:hypothetical protein NDN08_006456 [Rhodosorus marinus]|uniref:Uncharacterized protein n=1 Tax=Rhodosorus marinus TaxID=101924 RepID=A0AAV8ULR0_9RHOD|nr:hypothetical protein NDN08_006456 [Rhodosorus marinus]
MNLGTKTSSRNWPGFHGFDVFSASACKGKRELPLALDRFSPSHLIRKLDCVDLRYVWPYPANDLGVDGSIFRWRRSSSGLSDKKRVSRGFGACLGYSNDWEDNPKCLSNADVLGHVGEPESELADEYDLPLGDFDVPDPVSYSPDTYVNFMHTSGDGKKRESSFGFGVPYFISSQ